MKKHKGAANSSQVSQYTDAGILAFLDRSLKANQRNAKTRIAGLTLNAATFGGAHFVAKLDGATADKFGRAGGIRGCGCTIGEAINALRVQLPTKQNRARRCLMRALVLIDEADALSPGVLGKMASLIVRRAAKGGAS